MFTLHHLNDSRSHRIFWLFELAQIDYSVVVYRRNPKTNLAPDSLKKIHPLGTAPIMTHDDVVIPESGAICEYIARHSEQPLIPESSSQEYIDVQFWSHYAEGSFLPPLVAAMVLNKAKTKVPFFIKPIANGILNAIMDAYFNIAIKRNFSFVEAHLQDKTWFVGNSPTVADVQMSFGLTAVYDAGRLDAFPNMRAYVERLRKDPAFIRATERMKAEENQH